MIATDLQPLDRATPPLSNRVIKVSREEPIAAELSDGPAVLVTWIGERTATCVMSGQQEDVYNTDQLAVINKARILVDHARLPWVSDSTAGHFMKGKRRRGVQMGRQKIHRCVGCKRTAGQTRFISPQDDYCIDCEGAGQA